jgi:alpha-galactosidase
MRITRMVRLTGLVFCVALFFCLPAAAGEPSLASTPPMGWNSWDSYGRTITEAQVKATGDWMAAHLKQFGWQYLVIDEGWYVVDTTIDSDNYTFLLDANGRFIPVPARFPSATADAGLKPLADYIHGKGLKFGIHMIRGIPRDAVAKNMPIADSSFRATDAADTSDACPWNLYNWGVKNSPAGQAYYDSVIKLYAGWNVDFIKVDCIADHPYKPDEIRMIHNAIAKSGRPIILSLSPGPTALDKADEVAKYAEMWRICDDFWDHWGPWEKHEWSTSLYQEFAITAKWAPHVAPGSWPDADMLPLGHLGPSPGSGDLRETRLTKDEQRTMMTLWSIFRSPLIMGGDLLSMDDWTTSLLTNPEVIAVNQHSRGNHAVSTTADTSIWTAESEDGKSNYLAVFNIGDAQQVIRVDWKQIGLTGKIYKLRGLWEHADYGKQESLSIKLAPHASALYQLDGK